MRIKATDGRTLAAESEETVASPPLTASVDVVFGCGVGDGVAPLDEPSVVVPGVPVVSLALGPPLVPGAESVPDADEVVSGGVPGSVLDVAALEVSVGEPLAAPVWAVVSVGAAVSVLTVLAVLLAVSVGVSACATPSDASAETIITTMIAAKARSARARTLRPSSTNPPSAVDTAGR